MTAQKYKILHKYVFIVVLFYIYKYQFFITNAAKFVLLH